MINDAQKRVDKIIHILRDATKEMTPPATTEIVKKFGQDPFLVLISCLLSLRTRDKVTLSASERLFKVAKSPHDFLQLPILTIEKIIYPVGFYKRKSAQLHQISADLIERFNGKVPKTESELLSIKGVGRKTMNLVRAEGFGIPAICVDTHVHRVSNRLGLVKTKTPDETERMLKQIVPQHNWIEYTRLIVTWGQNICVPISPFCSKCALVNLCPKVNVLRSR